jgi:hypothetical protein
VLSQPGGAEDDEAGGGGGDDGYDQNGQTDELEEVNQDTLSPFEDPPPPPDPPSQTTAADPDPKSKGLPLWYLLLLALLSLSAFSVVKFAFRRIRCSLQRIKVYTGKSVLNLFIYIERPICEAVAQMPAISPLGSPPGFDAPLWIEGYGSVRQAVELDNARLLEALMLPLMLKLMGLLIVVGMGVLIRGCWQRKEVDDVEVI